MSSFQAIDFNILEQNLSHARLSTYLGLSKGDKEKAKELYLKNIEISRKLYFSLMELEVILRNKIDNILSESYHAQWLTDIKIINSPRHLSEIEKIKIAFNGKSQAITKADIIASLMLGFWVSLFSANYDRGLWRRGLYKVFSHSPQKLSRNFIRLELEKCRNLRNRIAHCECILKYPLSDYRQTIINLVLWIEPKFKLWIEELSSYE